MVVSFFVFISSFSVVTNAQTAENVAEYCKENWWKSPNLCSQYTPEGNNEITAKQILKERAQQQFQASIQNTECPTGTRETVQGGNVVCVQFSNTSDEADISIASIIIIVIFLIIGPIMIRQVWINHSRLHNDPPYGARTSRSAHSTTEQNRGKDEQSRYEEFTQRRKEKRKKGKPFRKDREERKEEKQQSRQQSEQKQSRQQSEQKQSRQQSEQKQSRQHSEQKHTQPQDDEEDTFETKKRRNGEDIARFAWSRFYGILDIPANPNDYEKVRKAHRVIASSLHTDRYPNASQEDNDMMVEKLSHINAGMKLIKDSRTYNNLLP